MECLQLIRPFSSSVVLAVQSTCVSFVPLSASTGHFIFDNCLPTFMVMKWRMYVLSACCNAFAIMGLSAVSVSSVEISFAFLPSAISSRIFLMVLQ